MSRYRYPKEVPMLEAKDICKGMMSDQGETHCLMGWAQAVFAPQTCDTIDTYVVFNALPARVRQCFELPPPYHWGPDDDDEQRVDNLIGFNDSEHTKEQLIAKVWNRSMAKLGYTEGNPEA